MNRLAGIDGISAKNIGKTSNAIEMNVDSETRKLLNLSKRNCKKQVMVVFSRRHINLYRYAYIPR